MLVDRLFPFCRTLSFTWNLVTMSGKCLGNDCNAFFLWNSSSVWTRKLPLPFHWPEGDSKTGIPLDVCAPCASENPSSVDFRPCSAHNDSLFIKLNEIWSGLNTECFILKLTGCFNVVSVPDFLSCLICSVLNCYNVLCHPTKLEALRICCGGLRITGAGGSTHID